MVSKRLPYAFVLASLMITCSKNDSDKRQDPVIPPVAGPGCSDVAEGQEKALTYYKKARAALNETCSNLALQVTATCQQGKLNIQGEGFPACDETVLSKVTIKATSTTVKVDEAPLLLTLEGVDQDGQTVVVDNSLATWTSSNELVTVTADGHVTAKAMVNDVVIKAVVKDLVAEVKVTAIVSVPPVVRKDCGEIKDGATKEFPRFKAALVNFQSKCESYQAQALCDNGEFVFKPEDSITECKVAPVKSFSVNPEALALKGGESRPVTAEAVDESEFKGALNFADVKWTVEAAAADQGKITVADGNIALSADLVEDASIKAQYLTFTKTISLAKVKIEPTRISFEKETYLLKNGDTLDLKVLGFAADKPVAVDSAKLVLESSDTQKVVIENNVAKVLTPGASVTITAKYAGDAITAQTKLTIEDELKLETAATRDPKDEGTVTADHPYVTAAAQITLSGPSVEKTPVIVSKNEVCSFRIYLSQSRWMVDVNLKAAPSQVIPEACQAEISVTSAAGQKPVLTVDVPVRFVSIDFKESILKDASKPDNLIATLTYKLSSNVKLTNLAVVAHKIAELSPATCKFSAQQKDGVVEVLADITAAPETKFCAGFLTYVLDTNGKQETVREQLTVSKYRPFLDTCADRDPAIKLTIGAINGLLRAKDCKGMDKALRTLNSDSVYFRNAVFTLALDSRNLTNLEPLARLTGLRELILTDNPITDVSPLASLKSLTRLDVDFTDVKDFSPLYLLSAMKSFDTDAEKIDCKKSEVTNKPLKNLCTQE